MGWVTEDGIHVKGPSWMTRDIILSLFEKIYTTYRGTWLTRRDVKRHERAFFLACLILEVVRGLEEVGGDVGQFWVRGVGTRITEWAAWKFQQTSLKDGEKRTTDEITQDITQLVGFCISHIGPVINTSDGG